MKSRGIHPTSSGLSKDCQMHNNAAKESLSDRTESLEIIIHSHKVIGQTILYNLLNLTLLKSID